tara:strand:- start:153 stop:461 length:309 start_codon:yes stop_codon:yes gene_type:complete
MSDNNDPFKYIPPHEAAKSAEVTKKALGRYREIKNQFLKEKTIDLAESNREKQRNKLKRDYNRALKEAQEFAAQRFGQGSTMIRKEPTRERSVTSKDIARPK